MYSCIVNNKPSLILNQVDLFDFTNQNKNTELMSTIDKINNRFPEGITLSVTGMSLQL